MKTRGYDRETQLEVKNTSRPDKLIDADRVSIAIVSRRNSEQSDRAANSNVSPDQCVDLDIRSALDRAFIIREVVARRRSFVITVRTWHAPFGTNRGVMGRMLDSRPSTTLL